MHDCSSLIQPYLLPGLNIDFGIESSRAHSSYKEKILYENIMKIITVFFPDFSTTSDGASSFSKNRSN